MDYTYTLQPGTKAVAQQVNKNFDDANARLMFRKSNFRDFYFAILFHWTIYVKNIYLHKTYFRAN